MAANMSMPVGRLLHSDSWNWFYSRLKSKSNNFSSAKAYENMLRRRTSDSENDSGYAPSSDCHLKINQASCSRSNTSNMADSASHEDCDDDEEEEEDIGEEEEAAEIHHSIETIVEGLLGSTLDDASVDRIYQCSPEYEKIFSTYHSKLVNAIRNLSQSLQRALHSIPHENDITPTAAHAALKCLIIALVADCQELPYLQVLPDSESHPSADNLALIDIDIFCSYEGLVASAIINKVVEEVQAKFVKSKNCYLREARDENAEESVHSRGGKRCSCERDLKTPDVDMELTTESFSMAELPLECVQIEEIEEITQEFTDSEDDKFSNISHQSSGLQSIDELGMQRCGSEVDLVHGVQLDSNWKTPFPEFGPDLVDDVVEVEDSVTCYPALVTSWEDNWLFRKKKVLPLCNSIKYQLLTYFDEPPCMLIPCPSENTYADETDELSSDLSESHSVGSLELFSDSEQSVVASLPQKGGLKRESNVIERSATICSVLPVITACDNSVSRVVADGLQHMSDPEQRSETVQSCKLAEVPVENVANHVIHNNSDIEPSVQSSNCVSDQLPHVSPESNTGSKEERTASHEAKQFETHENQLLPDTCSAAGDIFLIPTQPGTIAEREHRKWMNAVPLKNNPYSAENISRRSTPHRQFSVNASSFEEFEQKLGEFPHHTIEKPLQTKLYCGLNSIDGNRYKRDYYVNNSENGYEKNNYKVVPCFESFNCESCGAVPEETLNSLEEKVYISAGKVFTLENHVKRLEREVKDLSLSSDSSFFPQTNQYYFEKVVKNTGNDDCSSNTDNRLALPSVKVLATKFNTTESESQNMVYDSTPERTVDDVKIKKSRPCVKVHSLTARSLSREFRDRAKQNLPKPMNRLLSVPPQVNDDVVIEPESICNTIGASQSDTTHGYTSDESSTSSSSLPRMKAPRNISRSILERASYWERRVEQGLLSDASVSEEFPGLEPTPT